MILKEIRCNRCGEPNVIDLNEYLNEKRIASWIYGETTINIFETHISIPLSDWNKIKQRLIPVLKEGENKNEARSSNKQTKKHRPPGSSRPD